MLLRVLRLFCSFSCSLFRFIICTNSRASGLVASKPGHSWGAARTVGASQLRTARQFSPLGSSTDSHCFLRWLLESFGFRFRKFHSHSQLSLELRAPGAHIAQPWYCSGFTWCSTSASSPSAPAERAPVGAGDSSPQKAEAERVPFLMLDASRTPLSTVTSQKTPESKRVHTAPRPRGRLS